MQTEREKEEAKVGRNRESNSDRNSGNNQKGTVEPNRGKVSGRTQGVKQSRKGEVIEATTREAAEKQREEQVEQKEGGTAKAIG
jgi:hypothetical protein